MVGHRVTRSIRDPKLNIYGVRKEESWWVGGLGQDKNMDELESAFIIAAPLDIFSIFVHVQFYICIIK